MARALQRSDAPAPIEGLRDAIGDPRAVGRPPGGVLRQSLPRGFPFEAFPLASLHDVFAASARDGGLAAGFLAAVLAWAGLRREGVVLWASDGLAIGEAGLLNGSGLAQFGLDPGRLVLVRAHAPHEVLWALEEGLVARGMLGVVGEITGDPRGLDLTATRRLLLRSNRSGVPAFLLRLCGDEGALSAARTRWRVAPAPGRDAGTGLLGWPAWRVALSRNRDGPCGEAVVGFDAETMAFVQPQPQPQPPPQRPRPEPGAAWAPSDGVDGRGETPVVLSFSDGSAR